MRLPGSAEDASAWLVKRESLTIPTAGDDAPSLTAEPAPQPSSGPIPDRDSGDARMDDQIAIALAC